MKVLHITITDDQNGAGIAARRIHEALIENGFSSSMIVKNKRSIFTSIFQVQSYIFLDKIIKYCLFLFSFPYWFSLNSFKIRRTKEFREADIIHIHNIHYNQFFNFYFLPRKKPIVWTLHDMWVFTGNCNYTLNMCSKYELGCSKCPIRKQTYSRFTPFLLFDTTSLQWRLKKYFYSKYNLSIVSPSKWLLNYAKSSNIFSPNVKFEHIPNPINQKIFSPPIKKNKTKKKIHLLFVGQAEFSNPRKGFHYVLDALIKLNNNDYILEIAGKLNSKIKKNLYDLGYTLIEHGVIKGEEKLAMIYRKCDILLIPSLQDNFPNTILEAISCGEMIVAFDVGGIGEVSIKERLFLAKAFNLDHFVECIKEASNKILNNDLSSSTKDFSQYSYKSISDQYIKLYKQIGNKF